MRMKLGTLKRIIREAVMEAALPDADAAVGLHMVRKNLDRTKANPYNVYGMDIGRIYTTQGEAAAQAAVDELESYLPAYKESRKNETLAGLANLKSARRGGRSEAQSRLYFINQDLEMYDYKPEVVRLLNVAKEIYERHLDNPQIESLDQLSPEKYEELEADAGNLMANAEAIEAAQYKFDMNAAAERLAYAMSFPEGSRERAHYKGQATAIRQAAEARNDSYESNRAEQLVHYRRKMQGR